jgi:hypothetical protein
MPKEATQEVMDAVSTVINNPDSTNDERVVSANHAVKSTPELRLEVVKALMVKQTDMLGKSKQNLAPNNDHIYELMQGLSFTELEELDQFVKSTKEHVEKQPDHPISDQLTNLVETELNIRVLTAREICASAAKDGGKSPYEAGVSVEAAAKFGIERDKKPTFLERVAAVVLDKDDGFFAAAGKALLSALLFVVTLPAIAWTGPAAVKELKQSNDNFVRSDQISKKSGEILGLSGDKLKLLSDRLEPLTKGGSSTITAANAEIVPPVMPPKAAGRLVKAPVTKKQKISAALISEAKGLQGRWSPSISYWNRWCSPTNTCCSSGWCGGGHWRQHKMIQNTGVRLCEALLRAEAIQYLVAPTAWYLPKFSSSPAFSSDFSRHQAVEFDLELDCFSSKQGFAKTNPH